MEKFTFLIPVFNDWDSLNILLKQIDQKISPFNDRFDVIVLNDASTIKQSIEKHGLTKALFPSIKRVLSCHPFSKKTLWDPVK